MIIKTITLAIIQGITEFLPISSSGHTIIFGEILGLSTDFLILNIILHAGSLLAIILFFFKDIINLIRYFSYKKNPLIYHIIIATIPTAIMGLIVKKYYKIMENTIFVSIMLIITGLILISTKFLAKNKEKNINFLSSLIIGIVQGLATIPGISRSGSTISVALILGLKREESFKFSFLIVIPAIIGAILIEIFEYINKLKNSQYITLNLDIYTYIIGFIVSFIVSILSLSLLKIVIKKEKIHLFAYYCFLVSVAGLIIGG
ncbi:MAG TPA: undecaprenyl-diphosphate phosphatase [Spirochaetota bacterium]|nr:undecaprenyl-diphosphate phosphatase [Spirochaetota bacterium]HOM38011.1 undecaprenyl-diphosphate phosphatase [Spirochaetota bacterium]HPQ48815.1 undecaprenyl-diphosphate phosphatase [Spirochaetota bacterium]